MTTSADVVSIGLALAWMVRRVPLDGTVEGTVVVIIIVVVVVVIAGDVKVSTILISSKRLSISV